MAIPIGFFVFLILAHQVSCIGSLVHALPASQHPDSGPDAMVIPHQFLVRLAENYTLDSHWQRIGAELNITRYYKNLDCYYIDFSNDNITHDLSEESTLALIRSDPNVDRVSPNEVFRMDTGVTDHIVY